MQNIVDGRFETRDNAAWSRSDVVLSGHCVQTADQEVLRAEPSSAREREREGFHYVHWASTAYEDESMFMSEQCPEWQYYDEVSQGLVVSMPHQVSHGGASPRNN